MATGSGGGDDDFSESSSSFFQQELNRNDTERDLYAILQISKEASQAELQQAFRRLSLLYHPDKHADPRTKQLAMDLFIQAKKAYDIVFRFQIITRTKTAREILDEYERLAKEREEKRFQQITNPNGSVQMTLNLTDLFEQMNSTDDNDFYKPNIEISEFTVAQGIDVPLTNQDTATVSAVATTRNGRGSGSITTSFRRVLADSSWFRIDLGFGNRNILALRYFRRLTQKLQASVSSSFVLMQAGAIVTPGFLFSTTYQLGKHTSTSLQWKTGNDSFMKGESTWFDNMLIALKYASHYFVAGLHYDNQQWSIATAVQLGFVNTYGAIDGIYRLQNICNLRFSLKMFIFGPWIEYGIDRQLTKYTHGSATVALSTRMGVLLRLKFSRGSQSFTFPLQLSQEIIPSSVFYATVLPVIAYLALDRLIIRPFSKSQQEREQKQRQDEAREKQTERRQEAMNAQQVLRTIAERTKDNEGVNGLIIISGHYGHLISEETDPSKVIDVTIPLQAIVKDSKLMIATNVSKSNITGFYDPCIGEEKSLYIKYSLRSQLHQHTFTDEEPIILPSRDHLIT
ncbi:unnamed protein product [Didymodactylos carnosus]|uniref:J domain-containing protein n=1 Tax=Didymodactylos carnosus TaxID=1234261 RepID=A0A8S2CNN1_9BILA|nr:unnamed protein product [Didymodactylos carnosus]CAF3503811.1 unnamed protein product [Didymodactylos carnosus]